MSEDINERVVLIKTHKTCIDDDLIRLTRTISEISHSVKINSSGSLYEFKQNDEDHKNGLEGYKQNLIYDTFIK